MNIQSIMKYIGLILAETFIRANESITVLGCFKAKEFTALKGGENGANYTVTGDLTIKGITHSISLHSSNCTKHLLQQKRKLPHTRSPSKRDEKQE